MNTLECQMVEILTDLKKNHGAVGVKAEFEAEGTKLEELLRLKEVCMESYLKLVLKIGGCESIRDMLEARTVGVNTLVAPMVESAYALRKYLQAVCKVFSQEERDQTDILCNIETITAIENFPAMLTIPEVGILKGIVVERVDLCYSAGLGDQDIDNDKINSLVMDVAREAKKRELDFTVGGGVSAHSLPFFSTLKDCLGAYETRKIRFQSQKALKEKPDKGILKALAFEVLWLRNKLDYYKNISAADKERMSLIEQRYMKQIHSLMLQ